MIQTQLGYADDARLVIAHVDDIGMHLDETDGSLEVLRFGLARTGSAMVPAPDFRRFVGIWRGDPALDIGVHVTLTSEWDSYRWSARLSQDAVPSLYDHERFLWRRESLLLEHMRPEEAVLEMEAQIHEAFDLGLSPTHLDPHMGCFFLSRELAEAAVAIARRHNLVIPFAPPQLLPALRAAGMLVADTFNGFYQLDGEEDDLAIRAAAYESWLRRLEPGLHYLYLHPARMTDRLSQIVETPYIRAGDHAFWTSPATRRLSQELGIYFIGIRELQELQRETLVR